jgi:hypothetical protein
MSKKMTELFNSVPIKKTRNQKLMEKINAAEVAPLKDQKPTSRGICVIFNI